MRVYVGSCIWRTAEIGYMKSVMGLLKGVPDGATFGYFPQTGDALIERARAISATYFLRNTDYDVHLSIDSDIIGFSREETVKMCELAMEHDIVAGVYVCRSPARTFPATFYEEGVRVLHDTNHRAEPCKWAATGFMAVHRRVFERMAENLTLLHPSEGERAFYNFYQPFEYEDADTGEPILLSEDYAFCEKAKRLGFGCNIDPAVRLGHVGQYTYRLEDTAQPLIEPQPLALTRTGRRWRIKGMAEREKEIAVPQLVIPNRAQKRALTRA